jgi:ribosomal protein S18 acetylase RimI-like enzyme
MHSAKDILLCAEADGAFVGFCAVTITTSFRWQGKTANISTLVVDEKYRGQGIGTLLVARVCEIARLKDCKAVELESALHRQEAHRFYEGLGFNKRAYFFSKELL